MTYVKKDPEVVLKGKKAKFGVSSMTGHPKNCWDVETDGIFKEC